jgi:hypothetical protein
MYDGQQVLWLGLHMFVSFEKGELLIIENWRVIDVFQRKRDKFSFSVTNDCVLKSKQSNTAVSH